jgi:hypothetical protein
MTVPRVVRKETYLYSAGRNVTASGWVETTAGAFVLEENLSNKVLMIPLTNLPVGRQIKAYRVLGALGATTSNATVIDASLQKVTKGAGAISDSTVTGSAITQVSVTADTALDSEGIPTRPELISDDYQYYVKITGTTANNAACDASVIGVEVDIE